MGRKKSGDDKPAGAPEWIVTFSDMITLLLTFFVLLQSMAKVQVDKHKFETGQAALKKAFSESAVSGQGPEAKDGTDFENPKPQYAAEEGQDEPENRSIDAKTEMLRRILMDIEKMSKISPSHITAKTKTAFPTNIRFEKNGWTLNADAQQILKKMAEEFKINFSGQTPTFYVLAIAADASEKQSWAVSARRAQAAADYLRQQIGADNNWPVYCWGAGQGGEWVGHTGLVTRQTQILVNALTDAK